MKRPLLLAVVACLLLGSASTVAQTPPPGELSGAYIALGDSIAFGTGSSLPERRGYPALVQDLLEKYFGTPVETINLAVAGETAASFLSGGQLDAFTNRVNELNATGTGVSIVTLTLGGNEMLAQRYGSNEERQQALDAYRTNLDSVATQIRDAAGDSARFVMTTYYDLSEGDATVEGSDAWWVEQFNAVIRSTAARHGAQVAEVGAAFQGRIDELTYAPFDVHPKNQGFRAIARQVWSALALDDVPPEIEFVSASEATRRTPTLQFDATDNVDIASVRVTVGDHEPLDPVDMGAGRFVALLDLRNDVATEYSVVVEVTDSAGNTARAEQRLVVQID